MRREYMCDVDFVVTLQVPVEFKPDRSVMCEAAEAEVEYWLTEEAGRGGLDAVFGRFGVGETGYSLKPGEIYPKELA
jgi:hypothetical protein